MASEELETAEEVTLPDEPIKMGLEDKDVPYCSDRIYRLLGNVKKDSIMAGPLPNSMPVGTKRIICHLHCEPRPVCCVLWGVDCEHCSFKKAGDSRWTKQLVILSVKECSPAVYNFIIPLRASYLALGSLYPVVLLVNDEPDSLFLETIAHFPLVYWMKGSLESLDDLLKAGIHKAIHLVISNIGATHGAGSAEGLEDAETIVMVQKITRLFPSVNIITEMKEDSNMRFMHFQAHDMYTQEISRLEKRLKEKTVSNVSYMFRLPFAAGQVFSSAMLDRLLYQTFVKGYLICFVRLLLGIDAQKRSGHLSCVQVTRAMASEFPTYGELYQWLCGHSGQIPIALYKTERRPGLSLDIQQSLLMGNNNALSIKKGRPSIGSALFQKVEDYGNVAGFINDRLEHLHIATDEAYVARKPPRTLSYVIVNPSPSRKLKNGDMIYVLQPSSMQASPRKQQHPHWTPAPYSNRQRQPRPSIIQVFESAPSSTQGFEPPTFPKSASQVRWNLKPSSNSFENGSPEENVILETGEGAESSSPSESPPSSHRPFSVHMVKNAEGLSPAETGKNEDELSLIQKGESADAPSVENRQSADDALSVQSTQNADAPYVQSTQNADASSSQEPSMTTDEPSVQTRMNEHSPPQTRKEADEHPLQNADEPSPNEQTRENVDEPSPPQTRENEPSPPQTRENEPSPPQTRQNEPSPPQTTQNEPSPPQTRENEPSPPQTRENKPSPPQTTENEPSPSQTTQNEPSPLQTTQNEPSPPQTRQNGSSPLQTTENEPSPPQTRQNEPSPLQTTENEPSPSQTRQNEPSPSQTRQNEPSPLQTTENEPSPSQTRENEPSPLQTTENEPSPSQTRENEPSPLQTTENEPSPSQTRQNEPSPSQTRENEPSPSQTKKNTEEPSPVQTKTDTDEPSSHIRKHAHSNSSSSSQDDPGIQDIVLGEDTQGNAGSAPSASTQLLPKTASDEDASLCPQEEQEDDPSEDQRMLKKGSSAKSVSWGLLAGEDAATEEEEGEVDVVHV